MLKFLTKSTAGALILGSALIASPIHAADSSKRTVCVFDPVGNNGDIANLMKDFELTARAWGTPLTIKALTDEGVIANEFKAGKCDAAVITGLRAREFNRFSSSIEAVGAVESPKVMRKALTALMSLKQQKAQKVFRKGPYEVVGIMPGGSIYAFLRDRSWDSIDKIQGKKITVMEGDKASMEMVRDSGGTPVMATTTSFAGKFNNGSVDITFSPAAAYEPLELYRGLGNKGGIVDLVFSQLTIQMLIRWDRFPSDFGVKARSASLENFDRAFEFIDKATKNIDAKYWVRINPKDIPGYQEMMRQSRISLKEKGVYDGRMLRILKKIRCKENPTAAECSDNKE